MRRKIALSPRRKRWLGTRTTALKGTRLNYNVSQQLRYVRALRKLTREMTTEVTKTIMALFKTKHSREYFEIQQQAAMDASITSKAKKLMNKLTRKYTQLFRQKAPTLAANMLNGSLKTSETVLKTSLKQLSGGLTLNTGIVPAGMEDAVKAMIQENVALIKSLPVEYLDDVQGAIMRSIGMAEGALDLEAKLVKYAGMCNRRAELVALDQTSKVYGAINKMRMQAVGIKKFEWVHSGGGQHPRQSHIALDGQIFSFDDLPLKGEEGFVNGQYPGQAINCACTMTPVIEFEDGTEI
jgi:SPP1 gp7 family putative phage head morphogenesis protein